MLKDPILFTGLQAGALFLKHRVVLAPLTRQRADEPFLVPSDLAVEYYSQRATDGGLLITEATHISPEAVGYARVPGIWTEDHVKGWQRVCKAVHRKGGLICCQLWHTGRVAHPSFGSHPFLSAEIQRLPGPRQGPSVSASDVTLRGKVLTYTGAVQRVPPRPLRPEEMGRLVRDYAHAARCAMRAGFDAVEVHAAHGYLIDQFLADSTNQRTDKYGGSLENRCRLLREVLAAVTDVVGPGRCGVRISPQQPGKSIYGAVDSNPHALYRTAVKATNAFPLAYVLLTEPRWTGSYKTDANPETDPGQRQPLTVGPQYRELCRHTLIGSGGFTPLSAPLAVRQGTYDAVAFGRWFISNPDLPARLRTGAVLNVYHRDTFYTPGPDGYIDYPDLCGTVGAKEKYRTVRQREVGQSLGGGGRPKKQTEPSATNPFASKL